MIICSPEMDKFILPPDFKLKPFDLKLINTLALNHPFQNTVLMLWKYSPDFTENEIYDDDEYFEKDYFFLLDRYYRYGITFEDEEIYYEKKLYVYEDLEENPSFRYVIRNRYNFKQLAFNDVKSINLDDVDNGPINHSEIEKWKRKVIKNKKDRRTKLNLLDPNIYHSLITFVAFSNFEGRSHKKIENYFTYEGIDEIYRDINNYKNKYKHIKNYEDKVYNKIKKFLK